MDDVRAQVRLRGPQGNRDLAGEELIEHYRGRKETALALYYLWLIGEVMVHQCQGFERETSPFMTSRRWAVHTNQPSCQPRSRFLH
jgi:hypothetical protein